MAELNLLVRIADTDLDGRKHVPFALRKIKGVNTMFALATCRKAGIKITEQIGNLSDEQLKTITSIIKDPVKNGIPAWLVNRRWERVSGKSTHQTSTDLIIAVDDDIKIMKKIKAYKGVRHMIGQPVRGQRTRSNFRKNKGKMKLGVSTSGKKKGGKT